MASLTPVVLFGLAGCAPTDDAATGSSEPSTWSLDQESAVVLGSDEHFFDRVRGVVTLPGGVTAVADDGLRNVRAFDASGRLLWTFGREGDGPGEFRSVGGLWLAPDGTLGVWDGASRRITYVDTGGVRVGVAPIDQGAVDVMGPNVEVFLGAFPDGAVLLASLEFGDPPEAVEAPVADRWVVGRFDAQGVFEGLVAELDGMRRVGRNPMPFTQVPVVVVHGDSVLTIDGHGNEFTVFERGGGAAVGTLEVTLDERSDPPSRTDLRDALERSGRDLHLPALADLDDRWLTERPAVAGALSDPEGTVWVRLFGGLDDSLWLKRDALRPAPGGAWAAYDHQGRKVADVAVPADFVPFSVGADAVAGVTIDEVGVQRVAVVPLRRGR